MQEIDEYNIGTLIDYITLQQREARRHDSAYSDDQRYKTLKSLEPQVDEDFRNGRISSERYERFKRQLREWE